MSFNFDRQQGLVKVSAKVVGPSGDAVLQLALDTGATTTLLSVSRLQALGYDTASATTKVQIATASGAEMASQIAILQLSALGFDRVSFPVVCYTLPAAVGVDGLLGLDFLRGRILTIDFQNGVIDLK
jgi:predicted aspartyl protease